MNSTILNTIFLFGALQALLLILGVNIKNPLKSTKKQSTTLLLFILFLATIYYVSIVSDWQQLYSYFWILGSPSWMAIAPAYCLFTISLTTENFKFQKSHFWYFGMPVIFIIDGFLIYAIGEGYGLFRWVTTMEAYLDIWMSIFFIYSAYFIVRSYFRLIKKESHELTKSLIIFTKALLVILFLYAVTYIFIRKNYHFLFEVSLICLFMILIFAIVFRAFRLAPSHSFFGEPKYQNLIAKQKNHYDDFHVKVKSVIVQEELYLDPKLNLSTLSERTGISQNQLSQYFNIGLDSSFYEYINDIRLSHVEKLIRNGNHKDFTITGLAFESGFNSKTTFYKAFKKKHEITPSEYIQRVSN